jgi:tetratricopeptide (TPR) repeat protein
MDELVFKGKKYTRSDSKWVDADNMVVHETMQIALNNFFVEGIDFSLFTIQQLIDEGDKFKNSYTYNLAISFYEKAAERCDEELLQYILPRITSCYRQTKTPHKAVELFKLAKSKYGEGFITSALLTSVAAAYCDLKEYENAMRCCRWAYKRYGGEPDLNLSNVLARIKKESGIE